MPRQQTYFIWFSLLSIAFALYLFNPFVLYFLNDDFIHIPLSKDGVLFQRNSFRPLGDLSIRIDYLLWGNKAWGYHLTNLLLHILNTLLLYLLAKAFIKKYTEAEQLERTSLMVVVLFFVFAFHSESIFWIIGRSGSLGALFFLLSLLFYLQRSKGVLFFLLSLWFFEIGLLAYESVWIFPLVTLAISVVDYKLGKATLKKEMGYLASIFIVFFLHLIVRKQVIGEVLGGYEGIHFTQFNLPILAINFLKLIGRTFIPPLANQKAFVTYCVLLLVTIVTVIVLIRKKRKKPNPGYFLPLICCLFFLSFLPYLSLGIDTHSVEGERYLYLPSIFASLAMVMIIQNVVRAKRLQLVLFSFMVLFHLYFLRQSAQSYRIASSITKTTLAQVNLLQGKKRLFVDSLPQSNNGALIFRLGFEEGINWLKEPGGIDSLFVLSLKSENNFSGIPYKVEVVPGIIPRLSGSVLVRDPSQKQTYISMDSAVKFNPSTDAWFIFKNDRLQVVK
ncbi:MAG: hypothetical protein LH478_09210 [Chitinophagaceae bacterium]|nr:hypothetical protein [Chitinophagaceae bacterium]